MFRARHLGGFVLWLFGGLMARGDLVIKDYDPARHDRFHAGPQSAFIGDGLDFSGVGKAGGPMGSGDWATLISRRFVLASEHRHALEGASLMFSVGNGRDARNLTYRVVSGMRVGDSDLYVQMLDAPVADEITPFGIVEATPELRGRSFFVYGGDGLVGRNVVNGLPILPLDANLGATGPTVLYHYFDPETGRYANPEVGGDLATAGLGESGAPSLIEVDGQLALLGLHWFRFRAGEMGSSPYSGTGDTYVPAHIDAINRAILALGGSNDDLVSVVSLTSPIAAPPRSAPPTFHLNPVPEPASLLLMGAGVPLALLVASGWRRRQTG